MKTTTPALTAAAPAAPHLAAHGLDQWLEGAL
jgi:hypothetical protein